MNRRWGKNNRFRPDKKFLKENLYKLYIIQKKSAVQISKELYCSSAMIYRRLKHYKIKMRTMKEGVSLVNKSKLNITKKFLYNKYIIKKLSTLKISKLLKCSVICVRKYMKKFNISFRDLSKSVELSYDNDLRKLRSLQKGGTGIPYEQALYPLEFKIIRKSILERDNYKCKICNKHGKSVHHIDYNKKNNKSSNLITLCQSCHMITNEHRNSWKNHFKNLLRR
jgi:hypothetical protein